MITCKQHIFNVCSLKSRRNRRTHKAYFLWQIILEWGKELRRREEKFSVINVLTSLSQLKEQENHIFIICSSSIHIEDKSFKNYFGNFLDGEISLNSFYTFFSLLESWKSNFRFEVSSTSFWWFFKDLLDSRHTMQCLRESWRFYLS